ncbi:hypothetical protein HOH87_03865 [bacterium]|jgi:hypothetical protein|nr:hypothetical protein [bacterium]
MKIWGLLITAILFTTLVNGADPAFLKVKVYRFAVSESAFCTDPVVVVNNTDPEYKNVLDSPDFGSGELADGTYNCVIIEMSDNIKYASTSTTGTCTADEDETSDVCGNNGSEDVINPIDGSTTTCDGTENKVWLHLSTASTSTGGGDGVTPWKAPTTSSDATKGFQLSSNLVVSGATIGQFVTDGTGKIDGSGGQCEMQPPTFGFNNISN